MERARFIARHRCEAAARLAEIHRRGPVTTSRDRFITLALRGRGQHDVQCVFHDRDAAMFCEASSGAYGARPEPGLRQGPLSVAALHDAYGARLDTVIEVEAPRGGPPGSGCAPPTS